VYWKNPFTGKTEEMACATEEEAKKENSLIKHRLKFEREWFKRDQQDAQDDKYLSLEACYFLYLKEKAFSPKSLVCNTDAMKHSLALLGGMPIKDIAIQHIESVKERIIASGVKPVTVRGQLSVLRTVLRWCVGKYIDVMPDFPKLPPPHYKKFIPPTPEEISRICAVAAPHVVRCVILGSQLGVRVGSSELLKMRWSDIDLQRSIAVIHAAKKRPDQPWREVPIRESLLTMVKQWHKEDGLNGEGYIIHYKGRQIATFKKAWARALERAGITRHIRPYDLRHAFATEAIAAGIDVGTTAQLMGHSSPSMLYAHYQHVSNKQKRGAVESLPDIPKLRQENTAEGVNEAK
jgi:integrase